MSLLMEALRKAEAAKRAGQDAPDAEAEASATVQPHPSTPVETIQTAPEVFKYTSSDDLIALSPREEEPEALPTPAPPAQPSPPEPAPPGPRLNDNDDVLDDYLTTSHESELDETPVRQPSRDRVRVKEQRERAAAASMFDAKAPHTSDVKLRQRRQILAGALAVSMLVVGGAWWYVAKLTGKSGVGVNQSITNYNLEKRGPLGDPAGATPAPAASNTAPTQTVAAAPSTSPAVVQNAPTGNPAAAQTDVKSNDAPAPNKPLAPAIASKPVEAAVAVSDPQPNGRATDATNPVAPASALTFVSNSAATSTSTQTAPSAPNAATPDTVTDSNKILEISRSKASSQVKPALLTAYSYLQKGNLPAANDQYQELVTNYPNNRDALLGLAAVQLQLGNDSGARSTYLRLLKLNPLDGVARTGLLHSVPNADSAAYEKELLALQQQFPTLAPLSYALGNHYAQNKRWHEAQSAYFDALLFARRESPDNVNPDYAFNLAVSLEQLGQKRQALEYYKQAQLLANTVKPGFDPMRLRQRLTELEQK